MHAYLHQRSKEGIRTCENILLAHVLIPALSSSFSEISLHVPYPSNVPRNHHSNTDLSGEIVRDLNHVLYSGIDEDKSLALDMAFRSGPRSMSVFGGDLYSHSTASTPSLRAAQNPFDARPIQAPAENDSANVKVVVRVRQFVPRGMHHIYSSSQYLSAGTLTSMQRSRPGHHVS